MSWSKRPPSACSPRPPVSPRASATAIAAFAGVGAAIMPARLDVLKAVTSS